MVVTLSELESGETRTPDGRIGAVVIGRNEGERLRAALQSVRPHVEHLVYVDSGSTDESCAVARALGAHVVLLDVSIPFTAARARNAGLDQLRTLGALEYVQFMDGDCVLDGKWIPVALSYLVDHPDHVAVCGRRRERDPGASVYNRLCDAEWDTPVGETRACGGDALFRADALAEVNGFDPTLIAGEEPDLCFRLRQKGWRVRRLDQEMTLHDAAMTRFGQWWTRRRRGGHAFAEGFARHGRSEERYYRREVLRIVLWGMALPLAIVIAALIHWPSSLILAAAYPIQIARIAVRTGPFSRWSWIWAGFLILGFFAEAAGLATYVWRRLSGAVPRLIEYK